MSKKPPFAGFPREGVQFLKALARNNRREWFQAHQQDYRDYVLAPAQEFVVALGERLKTISRGIAYDTQTGGSGSIMRIHRDIRFSKDKSPYNTHVRMVFWEGKLKRMENSGFFVSMSPAGVGIYVGRHQFSPPFLTAYREAVVESATGAALEKALAAVRAAGKYEIGGAHYKRVPKGYDPEHKRAELLKYNTLYAHTARIKPEIISTPRLVEVCFEHCRNMAPLHQWLVRIAQRSAA